MARKPQVAVEPRKGGRWAVQTDGTQRADSLHDRKSDALTRARELAKNKKTELVVKGEGGPVDARGQRVPKRVDTRATLGAAAGCEPTHRVFCGPYGACG